MTGRNFGSGKTGIVILFAVVLLFLSAFEAKATHLRAGQIKVVRDSPGSRKCFVTVTVYTDTESPVLFGGEQDVLDFGDGTWMLIPETTATAFPGVPNVGVASFTVEHTFPGPGRYTVSYIEPNRNAGVLNMDNSVGTTFYIETQIDLTVLGESRSPILEIAPIDVGCVGVAFLHNPGASDPDGDSLSYEIVIPYRDRATPVMNYRDPNHPGFYTGVDYEHANEAGTGEPTFTINPTDGTLKWDAPGKVGEYNVAFIVREWRKINGSWVAIGFVRRDMQIIVDDCTNNRPLLELPEDVCVVAGTLLNETITGTDPDGHQVKIEAFSEILNFDPPDSPASYSPVPAPNPNGFRPSPATTTFTWQTDCNHVKDQPYQVVFKITDNPPLGPKLVTFETWLIKVVAPPPVLTVADVVLPQRHVTLEWDPYECHEDASSIQVWRRVAETDFTPDSCQTGMPASLGYTLIATVPVRNSQGQPNTTYTDTNGNNGLAAGAQYCYRLVAIFPAPNGGESYVSNEMCIPPIISSEPVITKVSVEKTGRADDGDILIEWTSPIEETQFPGPYKYEVQREGPAGFSTISPMLDDTVYTDAFLNTYNEQYTYRILLYSVPTSTDTPVDTSSAASSVWLDLNSEKGKIELNWSAQVPWSNQLQDYPMHRIYRGDAGATENELVLIDSVNVIENGFVYLDEGKLAPGDTLDGSKEYCYRVMTRGGYGNPEIREPLINFSQINCATPTDEEPACIPAISAFLNTCDDYSTEYGCNATNFTNLIKWSSPCPDDIRSYNLYVVGSDQPYVTDIRDTFYIDTNLASLARCYQITSIDRSGNESEKSEQVCNDNCPYYELPNVFSPGNADGKNCNDLFSAFGVPLDLGEDTDCPEVDSNGERCARFVLKVDFTVFNRWGKKVYHYVGQQGDENTIYINWDGRDEQGRELASAVYYYMAEVTFDVVNPKNRVKIIKGWVDIRR